MQTRGWSPKVHEELGWYVYALRDPHDGEIFYVGKGKGDRCFQHAQDAIEVAIGDGRTGALVSQKIDRIRRIQDQAGRDPEVLILRHKIPSEAAAYAVEAALLDFCRLLAKSQGSEFTGVGFSLTNVMGGWDSSRIGLMTPAALEALYSAEPLAREDITVPAILVKIPLKWTPDMSPEELYEATRGWWYLKGGTGPRRMRARYAIGVQGGIVRSVYTIVPGSWRNDVETPDRWGFDGLPVEGQAQALLNRDVSAWANRIQYLTYINCD